MSGSRNNCFVPTVESLDERVTPSRLMGTPREPLEAPVTLEGHQSLVFFLGGIPSRDSGVNDVRTVNVPREMLPRYWVFGTELPDSEQIRHRMFAIIDRTNLQGDPVEATKITIRVWDIGGDKVQGDLVIITQQLLREHRASQFDGITNGLLVETKSNAYDISVTGSFEVIDGADGSSTVTELSVIVYQSRTAGPTSVDHVPSRFILYEDIGGELQGTLFIAKQQAQRDGTDTIWIDLGAPIRHEGTSGEIDRPGTYSWAYLIRMPASTPADPDSFTTGGR